MPVRVIQQGAGLQLDRARVESAPGGMLVADNVMLHRPGLIVPRPGFGDTTGIGDFSAVTGIPVRGWAYDGDIVVQDRGGGPVWYLSRLSTAASLGLCPPPGNRGASAAAEMRSNLYLTSSLGVQRITSAGAALARAGVRTDYHTFEPWAREAVTGTSGAADRFALDETSSVAYRYCWVSRDANDYERRSAPSPRIVMRNSDSVAAYVSISRLYLPTGIGAGDWLELYRTVNSNSNTADPGDECYLATVHEVTAANASAGYIDVGEVWDQTMDADLGRALYTNPSQGGIVANANEVPPLAECLAQWSDVMWYGNTTERAVLIVEPVSVYSTGSTEHDLDGIHYSTKQGTISSGSLILGSLDNVNGMKVGQYVVESGFPVVNGTDVTEGDRSYLYAETKIATIQTTFSIINNANITAGDAIEFTNISRLTGGTGRFTWASTPGSSVEVVIGATTAESIQNLVDAINSTTTTLWGAGNITAVVDGTVARVSSDDGHGLPASVTQTVANNIGITYRATVDTAAKATATNESFDVVDYVILNGQELYFTNREPTIAHYEDDASSSAPLDWYGLPLNTARSGTTTNADLTSELAREMGDALNAYAIRADLFPLRAYVDDVAPVRSRWNTVNQESPGPASIALIATDYATPITFEAPVRPDSWRVSGGESTSLDTSRPGRLFWSKPGEPEAVPTINFVDVGNVNEPILALVPLDDALLVFKTDGIFRVTGSAPSSWVVDDIRRGTRLLAPDCVAVLDGVAYAWTDRGVLAVTEGGASSVPISAPVAEALRAPQQLLPRGSTDPARGFWMAAHSRLGLVLLSLATTAASADPETEDIVGGSEIYVWARATGAWSRWTRADRHMVYDPAEDRMLALVVGDGESYLPLYERDDLTSAASFIDEAETITLSGTTYNADGTASTTVTSSGSTPTTCDLMTVPPDGESFGTARRITAVSGSSGSWSVTLGPPLTFGVAYPRLLRGYAATMQWQAQQLAHGGQRWQEMHLALEALDNDYDAAISVEIGGATHYDSAPTYVNKTLTEDIAYSRPVRAGVPRACVRTPHLYPAVRICTAATRWELSDVTLHHTPTSRRVAR